MAMRSAMGAACLAAAALGGQVLMPAEAQASALGYAYWGTHVVKDVPVPSGQMAGLVQGDGTRIDKAGGDFVAAGNICNWSISIVFYDKNKKIAKVQNQPRQHNCTHGGIYKVDFDGWRAPEGRACIRLYRDFGKERLASVCHSIHK